MSKLVRDHLRSNVVGYIALFCFAMAGTATATHPGGANTISSVDIINGEVKNDDLGANAVGSGKIADRQVKNADLSIGASSSNTIADGGIQGIDVKHETLTGDHIADNSLTGADVAESTFSGVLDCPANTVRTEDVCYGPEQSGEDSKQWRDAAVFCATQGLRLPTVGEALLVMRALLAGQTLIWTSDSYWESGTSARIATKNFSTGQLDVQGLFATTAAPFRCVTSPTA